MESQGYGALLRDIQARMGRVEVTLAEMHSEVRNLNGLPDRVRGLEITQARHGGMLAVVAFAAGLIGSAVAAAVVKLTGKP